MKSEILPISDLPIGIYETEIVELSTVRRPHLMVVWIFEIKCGDFSGTIVKYLYRADKSPFLTSANFQAVGISETNFQTFLEDPGLISGAKVTVAVEENSVRFIKAGEISYIEPGKFLKSPF